MEQNSMVVTQRDEVQVGAGVNPVKSEIPDISLDPKDFQKEMQKIAAEQGTTIDQPQSVEPTLVQEAAPQPEPQQAVAQPPVQVPEKFQTKDGQVDVSKVEKSTVDANEAIQKYLAKEAELKTQMNKVRDLSGQVQSQTQQPQQYYQGPITPELINQALKTNDPGKVLYELTLIAKNEAAAEAAAMYQNVNARVEAQQRGKELQDIANTDRWVFSEEGINSLANIRQANPWINQAPEPWKAAYDQHLANEAKKQRFGSQVNMPTPQAPTVRAPATPVGAVTRNPASQVNVNELAKDPRKLNAYLDGLKPEQQKAFWQKTLPGAR